MNIPWKPLVSLLLSLSSAQGIVPLGLLQVLRWLVKFTRESHKTSYQDISSVIRSARVGSFFSELCSYCRYMTARGTYHSEPGPQLLWSCGCLVAWNLSCWVCGTSLCLRLYNVSEWCHSFSRRIVVGRAKHVETRGCAFCRKPYEGGVVADVQRCRLFEPVVALRHSSDAYGLG